MDSASKTRGELEDEMVKGQSGRGTPVEMVGEIEEHISEGERANVLD